MKYTKNSTLETRGNVDPGSPVEVESYMKGEEIAQWTEGHTQYGMDYVTLFPCFNKEHGDCFLVERVWDPATGYCASGTEEEIISFTEGIELLCLHGIFPWTKQKEERKDED
jgi:hypothetical protein